MTQESIKVGEFVRVYEVAARIFAVVGLLLTAPFVHTEWVDLAAHSGPGDWPIVWVISGSK